MIGRRLFRPLQFRSVSTLPQQPIVAGIVALPRTPIAVYGKESAKFLNGLLPIIPPRLDTGAQTRYTSVLTPNGRITADAFVSNLSDNHAFQQSIGLQNEVCFMLEMDNNVLKTIMSTFKLHALTAKVQLRVLDNLNVYSVWNDESELGNLKLTKPLSESTLFVPDPRVPGFGHRLVTEVSYEQAQNAVNAPPAKLLDYKLRRCLFGLAEGEEELRIGKSIPLEFCFDYLGGIDFDKGCYLGQELTCRMHQQNSVKKRLMPVLFSKTSNEADTNELNGEIYKPIDFHVDPFSSIFDANPRVHLEALQPIFSDQDIDVRKPVSRPSGRLITSVGNMGLAVLRTDYLDHSLHINDVNIEPMQPFWWPQKD